jgi:hypothetical protein
VVLDSVRDSLWWSLGADAARSGAERMFTFVAFLSLWVASGMAFGEIGWRAHV